jgi:hypothetical protein
MKVRLTLQVDLIVADDEAGKRVYRNKVKHVIDRAKTISSEGEYYVGIDWLKEHILSIPFEKGLRVVAVTTEGKPPVEPTPEPVLPPYEEPGIT